MNKQKNLPHRSSESEGFHAKDPPPSLSNPAGDYQDDNEEWKDNQYLNGRTLRGKRVDGMPHGLDRHRGKHRTAIR